MDAHMIWMIDHTYPIKKSHASDYYQLMYCHQSGGKIFVGGQWHDAVRGKAYFIHPGETRAIEPHGLCVSDFHFVVNDKETILHLEKVPSVFCLDDIVQLKRSFEETMKEGFSGEPYSITTTDASLSILLAKLIRYFVCNSHDKGENDFELPPWNVHLKKKYEDEWMDRIISFIEENIESPITLNDLSGFANFNKSYLGKRFKASWGVPPMKYVNWIRIERAKELLLTSDNSITDIAKKTGFQSIHYFSRAFKKNEKMTPQAYRARYRKRNPIVNMEKNKSN